MAELLETEVIRTKCDVCNHDLLRDCWDGAMYEIDGEPIDDYGSEITNEYEWQITVCSEDCRDEITEGPLHYRQGHFYRRWR